jgi:hypothetical protein
LGKVVFPNASRDPSRTRSSSHHPLDGRAERMSRVAQSERAAVDAAGRQKIAVPGQARIAQFVREYVADLLTIRGRIEAVNTEIAEDLDRHPDSTVVRSLPGWGMGGVDDRAVQRPPRLHRPADAVHPKKCLVCP